jgi:hypothetical protein
MRRIILGAVVVLGLIGSANADSKHLGGDAAGDVVEGEAGECAAIGDVAIRRAGVAKDVVFETSRRSGNDVSYLVAYDPAGLALGATGSAVVAEIEIESARSGIAISIDPALTMLGDLAGTKKAAAVNQRLELSGTTIGGDALPRPRVPRIK